MSRFKFASSTPATAVAGGFESLKARTVAEMVRLRGVECTKVRNLSLLNSNLAVCFLSGVSVHSSILRFFEPYKNYPRSWSYEKFPRSLSFWFC